MRRIRHRLGLGRPVRPMKWLARALGLPVVMALFAVSAQPALAQHGINPPPAPAPAPPPVPPPVPAPPPPPSTLPTITAISPTSGPLSTTVTIAGSNLAGAMQVTLSCNVPAQPVPFTLVSSTVITATVPFGAQVGPCGVTVTTTGGIAAMGGVGAGGVLLSGTFTVTSDLPPPGVVPPRGGATLLLPPTPPPPVTPFITVTSALLAPGFSSFEGQLRLQGAGAKPLALVTVDGGGGTANATADAAGNFSVQQFGFFAGACEVTVTDRNSAAIATLSGCAPQLWLTGFTPASGPVGTVVTLTGNNVTGATSVTLGGVPAPFTVLSATTLRVTVPAGVTTTTAGFGVVTPNGSAGTGPWSGVGGVVLQFGVFTVTAGTTPPPPPPQSSIVVTKAQLISFQLRVEGTGAAPNTTVTVLASNGSSQASGVADAAGNFRVQAASFSASFCQATVTDGTSSVAVLLAGC